MDKAHKSIDYEFFLHKFASCYFTYRSMCQSAQIVDKIIVLDEGEMPLSGKRNKCY